MVRILQICSSLDGGGGVQAILKNYYSYMNTDEFRFDFIVHGDKIGEFESFFEAYGSKIHHVTPRRQNPVKNILEIAKVIKDGNYDIVHCHQDYHGAIAMLLAKHYGVKKRIIHCHRAFPPEKWHNKLIRSVGTFIIKKTATNFMACSQFAAEWLYRKKDFISNKVILLKNATNLEKFLYSEEKRDRIRKELKLDNSIVIGHVGRFTYQKNHELLIDIFNEFLKTCSHGVLMLIGDGELKEDIVKKVKSLGIEEKILFLGIRSDVFELLNVMDVFVFPSRYEGLPIVVIELQANGLPAVCSEFVAKEVAITNDVFFVEKEKYTDISQWIILINKALEQGRSGSNNISVLRKAGYDIKIEAKKLEAIYKGE